MRFLSTFIPDPKAPRVPPSPEQMAEMGRFVEESFKNGTLLMTGGLEAASKGKRLSRSGDQITVVDGPYSEAKEIVGGFAILQAESTEAAIELVKSFLKIAGDGECDLRGIMDSAQG